MTSPVVEMNDFRVLFTPRTGSRSLEQFLVKHGGKNIGQHHTPLDKVPRDTMPNYFVTREPCSQLESWYHAVNTHTKYTLENFLVHYGRMGKFKPVNMYMPIYDPDKDKVFIYEDGMWDIVHQMGFIFVRPVEFSHIGKSSHKCEWTDDLRELVKLYFPEDCAFYTSFVVERAKQLMLDNMRD